ncbi:hypothetical protein OA161_00555 [Candidatus Pelagibacter sp.]|nr:hypothetical protein [Candidatus Pelagibacter sp.]
MKKNFKYILEERLQHLLIWQNNCLEYFKHQQIREKAKLKYYQHRKLEGLFHDIYYFPTNFLGFLKKRNEKRIFVKGLIEIQVLREELDKIDNIKKIGENNG